MQGRFPKDWQSWLKLDLKQWILAGLSPEGQKVVLELPDFQVDNPGNVEWAQNWLKKDKEEVLPKASPQSERRGWTWRTGRVRT